MTETIRYATEHDGTMTIRGYPTTPLAPPPVEEEPVTEYKRRLEDGEYLDNNGDEADVPGEATLAELRAEADARGLPTYGKKSQLAERIAKHDAEQAEAPAPVEDAEADE